MNVKFQPNDVNIKSFRSILDSEQQLNDFKGTTSILSTGSISPSDKYTIGRDKALLSVATTQRRNETFRLLKSEFQNIEHMSP